MNPIKRLKLGITDPYFYKIYLKEGLWKAFFFVLLINMLMAIPATTLTGIKTQQTMNNLADTLANDFSGLTFSDYQLSTIDGDSLFKSFELNGIKTAMAIDTIDQYSIGDLSNYDTGIIFDKEYILSYEPGFQPVKYYYKDLFRFLGNVSFNLSGSELASMIRVSNVTLVLVIAGTLVIQSVFLLIFTTLLISLAASVNNRMLQLKMSYANTLKISLYSLLLPLMIYQLLALLPMVSPLIGLLVLYFGSGRFIAKTYRNIYTDNLKHALNEYSKQKKQKQNNKNDHDV